MTARKRRFIRLVRTSFLLISFIVVLVTCWVFYDLPSISHLNGYRPQQSIKIVDRNGLLLYELIPTDGGKLNYVDLDIIPTSLKEAVIATEDSSFYTNSGIDLVGLGRAAFVNIKEGTIVEGGSTISQQVIRLLVFTPEERKEISARRKIREMFLAWRLNQILSKDEILSLYLNNIYFGNLAYGVDAAAQTYFGKPVDKLTDNESILLAGLPQAPEYYNPFIAPELAKSRQLLVLELMQKNGYITSWQKQLLANEPLVFEKTAIPSEALHFIFMIRSEIDNLLTSSQIQNSNGLTIQTTLDLNWQKIAEAAIDQQLDVLRNNHDGVDHNVNNMALVALEPKNGAVRVLVGSHDYFDSDHNGAVNMALAPRQPGSALKPFVYALSLDPESELPKTAASMILDVQTDFVTNDGLSYSPTNYDHKEHGPVSLRLALASSLNIPAIIILNEIGPDALIDFLTELGITSLKDAASYNLSLALGGGNVSLLDLTKAYASFPNSGYKVEPYFIQEIRDNNGKVLYNHQSLPPIKVLDERIAWLVTDILSDDNSRVLGFGLNSTLRLDQPAAVKTGTTSNFHDNWTIGYTPNLVVGVWAGNANQEPMWNVTGLTGAAPVWHQFIRQVSQKSENSGFHRPNGLVQIEVCNLSGFLPTENCPFNKMEWFIEGTEPREYDSLYQLVTIDRLTGKLADETTIPQNEINRIVLNLPPQASEWANTHGHLLLSDVLDDQNLMDQDLGSTFIEPILFISSPAPETIYRISSELPQHIQKILIEVSSSLPLNGLRIFVDGREIGFFNDPPYTAWLQLEEGSHEIRAEGILPNTEIISTSPIVFEVRK